MSREVCIHGILFELSCAKCTAEIETEKRNVRALMSGEHAPKAKPIPTQAKRLEQLQSQVDELTSEIHDLKEGPTSIGKEAEELRCRFEALINYDEISWKDIDTILEEVDARDSLKYLEDRQQLKTQVDELKRELHKALGTIELLRTHTKHYPHPNMAFCSQSYIDELKRERDEAIKWAKYHSYGGSIKMSEEILRLRKIIENAEHAIGCSGWRRQFELDSHFNIDECDCFKSALKERDSG